MSFLTAKSAKQSIQTRWRWNTTKVKSGGGFDDFGNKFVVNKIRQVFFTVGIQSTAGNKIIGKMIFPFRTIPFNNGIGQNFLGFVFMTIAASIGRSIFYGKIWARHPKTVVMAQVIAHIQFSGHVATDALGRFSPFWMKSMTRNIVFIDKMTLGTGLVANAFELCAMRIMAIRTFNPFGKHSAL